MQTGINYILSYYVMRTFCYIKHPKWWQVWKKAELCTGRRLERMVFHSIPKDEADIIIQASKDWWASSLGRLLRRLMGDDVQRVQLEEGTGSTWSNPSEYVSVGRVKNEIPNAS